MNKVEMIEKSKPPVERLDAGEQSVSSGLVKSKADNEGITDVGGEGTSTEEARCDTTETNSEIVREREEGVAAAVQQQQQSGEESIK